MTKFKVEIDVSLRTDPKQRMSKSIVYFFHHGETILDDLENRRSRPAELYKTYLGDVAEAMGLPRTAKFSWSQKAGCRCGCSPGFICSESRGKNVFVTLSKFKSNVEEEINEHAA